MDEMNYDAMGKEALRAEMRNRELSYSKLDNAGMRAALRADDAAHADFAANDLPETPVITLTPEDKRQIADEAASRTPRTRAGLKIEANRDEKNGVKQRSKGGVCREVWDWLDALVARDGPAAATAKEVRVAAEQANWNTNNALIEFYKWRKFNGINGRVAK